MSVPDGEGWIESCHLPEVKGIYYEVYFGACAFDDIYNVDRFDGMGAPNTGGGWYMSGRISHWRDITEERLLEKKRGPYRGGRFLLEIQQIWHEEDIRSAAHRRNVKGVLILTLMFVTGIYFYQL